MDNELSICNHDSCITSAFRGLRNGIYYGAKIRFIHSLIMTFLFRQDTLKNKLKSIFTLTYEHSKNLGLYVFLYKSISCIIRNIIGKHHTLIPFIAGCIASYFMWSTKNPVNQQIMLYLLSRNILALTTFFDKKLKVVLPQKNSGFAVTSILCWGIVMYLFEKYPNSLQSSLFSSMDFLYNSSNFTESWRDFIPFYIPF